jgi:hypothetical protein
MDDAHDPDVIDVRKHYTPRQLEQLSGVPARVIRQARDLPRLHVDAWNRINGGDFIEWLRENRTLPQPPNRENAIRERVTAQLAREARHA